MTDSKKLCLVRAAGAAGALAEVTSSDLLPPHRPLDRTLRDPTFQTQIHDFNPGIAASGLFWTIPVDDDDVHAAAGAGRARLSFEHLDISDFGSLPRSLTHQPPIGTGRLNLVLRWQGGGQRNITVDPTNTFRFNAVPGPASIRFHVHSGGFDYESAPDGQTTVFAAVGNERNGVFFNA